MTLFSHLAFNELGGLLKVIQHSFEIRSHYDLLNWLNEDVQSFLPHDILISAWGDFESCDICYDIVSELPGVRTENFSDTQIQPFLKTLFSSWIKNDMAPMSILSHAGFDQDQLTNPEICLAMSNMRCALIHGLKDLRGRQDCIYILLGPVTLDADVPRMALRSILPYIDTAFRQSHHLPDQYYAESNPPQLSVAVALPAVELPVTPPTKAALNLRFDLSEREEEIMHWVRKGKTNHEIGLILEISPFTVKNHVQRIFKKLDVSNRAQAVSKLENLSTDAWK